MSIFSIFLSFLILSVEWSNKLSAGITNHYYIIYLPFLSFFITGFFIFKLSVLENLDDTIIIFINDLTTLIDI
jgi:hypothetical protein